MEDAHLEWEKDAIKITVTSQLARSSILDQRDLFEQLREATHPLSPEIIFEINQSAQPEEEKTQPLTTRDKYEARSEEHTSELQSRGHLVCRLLLEKKNT